ncbi:unnamed protein product [Rhizophagus irregularis]|nr:unnamed protein product [Rhizophagus irregularis]
MGWDEKREPALEPKFCDVLQWTMRIVEDDGEIDFDFPAVDPYPLRTTALQFEFLAIEESSIVMIISELGVISVDFGID